MRKVLHCSIDQKTFLEKMLIWLDLQQEDYCVLNSNAPHYNHLDIQYDFLMGIGVNKEFKASQNDFKNIDHFIGENKDWMFGHLNYDMKNEFEALSSHHAAGNKFSNFRFFIPQLLIIGKTDTIEIQYFEDKYTESKIQQTLKLVEDVEVPNNLPSIGTQASEGMFTSYKNAFQDILKHINRGDVYELNYCVFLEQTLLDLKPAEAYINMNRLNPAPYSSLYKQGSNYVIGASPERFLKKTGVNLLSQPMKGTAPKGQGKILSEKNKNENVMIVDIVRNDLSRCAEKKTVRANKLFEVQTFPHVDQMISNVTCKLNTDVDFYKIISSTFPMGSMTGAPKIRAMELIDQYESQARGLFSGSIGYIDPDFNFDFNVNIRSLFFDKSNGKVSFPVGSAITSKSNIQEEYDECLLKAQTFLKSNETYAR